jgi:hypothetical protein
VLVPETAVHEDRLAAAGKYDIGLSWKISPVDAKAIPLLMEQGPVLRERAFRPYAQFLDKLAPV